MHPIHKHLKDTGTTQAQFANQINITKQYLSMILRGERWPGYRLSIKISEIISIDPIALQGFNRK